MALRGMLAVLLGIAAFVAPGVALALLVSFFGAYALIDGIFALVTVARWRAAEEQWWLLALKGIIGIGVGVFVFVHPVASTLALITLVGIWVMITGIMEIAAAIRLHRVIIGKWLLGLSGALSVLFGIALLALAFRLRGRSQIMGSQGSIVQEYVSKRLKSLHACARSPLCSLLCAL